MEDERYSVFISWRNFKLKVGGDPQPALNNIVLGDCFAFDDLGIYGLTQL